MKVLNGMEQVKYDVFISYSRKDTPIANKICDALERQGITYFIDRQGIGGGQEFPEVLADAIVGCRIMLYLASENSYTSKFTSNEITFAFNEKPKGSILPYIIDGSHLPPAQRFIFASVNYRTIEEHPIDTVLMKDLCQLLGLEYKVETPSEEKTPLPVVADDVDDVAEEGEEEEVEVIDYDDEADTGEGVKTSFSIGTLGHIDHGKTTLSEAICSVLAKKGLGHNYIDSTKEEIINGIRINYAQTEYKSKKHHYTHIDCLNYADYVKGLITRFHLDGAIVVVSATDGPMPQTREHILMARQLNIPRLVVFLNKCDLTKDEDMLELVEMEMLELLMAYGFEDDTPIIRGSALGALNGIAKWENKIVELLDACDTWFPEPVRDIDKPFLMPIEDVFYITGRGAVATGRIETGVVKVGDGVQILGLDESKRAVVTGVEMFRKILDEGEAGDNVGLLLRGVEKDEVKRGMIVTHPDIITPRKKFRASIYVLKAEEGGRHTPFGNKYRPQFYIRTMDLTGEIKLPRGMEMVMPGDNVEISVELIYPVALELGLRFDICEGRRTVGMGVITEIL